ncbi:hypothetical protein CENSYa_0609 [Cenarchaeum symbiosum A]|uniref:Uncharacterized protein n=1 Tax=Cenarchaeum symbiosum (strain A) TaxID=414004 RepID=A0RV75_CENSY|nr:hypothetical protein CENSYa_0609 [Cenarchaeum symbiosum A]
MFNSVYPSGYRICLTIRNGRPAPAGNPRGSPSGTSLIKAAGSDNKRHGNVLAPMTRIRGAETSIQVLQSCTVHDSF